MITGVLPGNGLSYAVKCAGRAVACCSLSVRCGSRAEGSLPEGIAHFVEHTLFKGTADHNCSQISSRLDLLGGELNAYTTKEEIVLHATVLKEDLWKAVRLLLEIASRPTFPEKEVATEKGVVIDEIISYKDSPSDDIFDRFEEMLFEGHDLGRSILGSAASVRKMKCSELKAYVRANFIPRNMVLSIVAPFEEKKMVSSLPKVTEKYFPVSDDETPLRRSLQQGPEGKRFNTTIDKRHHEANAVIGGVAPSLYEEKERLAAVLLSNIIGGPGSNSLLNAELREKHGWVYGVECSYTQYSDSGIMVVTLGCDKPNLDKCLMAVDKILERMRTKPLSDAKLAAAKRQILGQLAVSGESSEAQCLSMGKSMLAFGKIASDEQNRESIMALTAGDIQAVAQRVFNPESISRLIFL